MWPRFIFLTDYTALERSTVSESVQSRQTGVPSARLLYVFSHKRVRSLNQSLKLDRCCYFCWCSAVGSVHEACLCDRPSYSLAKVRSFMSQQAFPKLIFPPAGHWGITVVIISVPLVSVCNTIKDKKKRISFTVLQLCWTALVELVYFTDAARRLFGIPPHPLFSLSHCLIMQEVEIGTASLIFRLFTVPRRAASEMASHCLCIEYRAGFLLGCVLTFALSTFSLDGCPWILNAISSLQCKIKCCY